MPTKAEGAIGGLDYTAPERKKMAEQVRVHLHVHESINMTQSTSWKCDKCGVRNATALPDAPPPLSPDIRSSNSNLRISQIAFAAPNPACTTRPSQFVILCINPTLYSTKRRRKPCSSSACHPSRLSTTNTESFASPATSTSVAGPFCCAPS